MKSVALDAGHYYGTSGKRSPDETYFEYEFNWDVHLKIKAHLERCGIKVYKTRSVIDVEAELADRVKVANNNGVDFFFSVHTNAATNTGWSTARGYSAHIYNNTTESTKAANIILGHVFPAMTNKYGLKNRGIKNQNLYVTRVTKMPSVLVEHAFHSSHEDVAFLKTQAFRRDIAECDARGICDYLGVKWINAPSYNYTVIKLGIATEDNLNIRLTPSSSGEKISKIHKNTQVEIVDESNENWYKILYGETYAYVHKTYIKITEEIKNTPVKEEEKPMAKTVIKTGIVDAEALNVRSGASTNNSKLGLLYRNNKVEITGETNGWYEINFDGKTGYVSGDYIKDVKAVVTETKKEEVKVETAPATKSITVSELKKMGYTSIIID